MMKLAQQRHCYCRPNSIEMLERTVKESRFVSTEIAAAPARSKLMAIATGS